MMRAVTCAILAALLLAACSGGPQGADVIAQAAPGGRVAFDVVKIDDAVLKALQARPKPAFEGRFKTYIPPPELKIAVGDTLSVVIWESSTDGLFGDSLTELSFPAGAAATTRLGQMPAKRGEPGPGGLTTSPELLSALFGNAPETGAAKPSGPLGTPPSSPGRPGIAEPFRGDGESEFARDSSRRSSTPGLPNPGQSNPGWSNPGWSNPFGAPGTSETAAEQLLEAAIQSGRPGTRIPDQPVGPDGAISIPFAGRIKVAGQTTQEVEQTIERRLGPKALDPQALVVVKRSAANAVSVAGEVIGGRRVALSPGGDRLLQVIAAAGGAHAPVHDTFVRLSRGGATATLPLARLVADPAQDIFAEPGDVLTLVRRPQTFSVFGATGRNTAISFTGDRLSLSEALAKAGGLDDNRADPRAVFLFRYEPDSLVRALGQPIANGAPSGLSPVVYRLDLHDAGSFLLARRFAVHDKDVIFVADAKSQPVLHFFQVLSNLTGPVQTGFLTCYYAKC